MANMALVPSPTQVMYMMVETFEYVDVLSKRTHTLCLRDDHKVAMISDHATYTSPWHGNWFDMGDNQRSVVFRWCGGDVLVNTIMRQLPGSVLRTERRDGFVRAVCVQGGTAQWDCTNDRWLQPPTWPVRV